MGLLTEKLKEVLMSIVPIVVAVCLLIAYKLQLPQDEFIVFGICIILVVIGFTIFLSGVELGINPIGSAIGQEIPRRKSRLFMILVVFAISFLVTIAEPDVNVFANQVHSLFTSINVTTLVYAIAAGVAIFLIIAAFKIVYKLSLRLIITISYLAVIAITLYMYMSGSNEFLGIAFDSGGVTTGPVTVPVLLALGIGICSVGAKNNKLDGFGMIGLASVGPILALLLMGMMSNNDVSSVTSDVESTKITFDLMFEELKESTISVLKALIPLLIFFVLFQRVFLKYSWSAVSDMVSGMACAGIGIIIFLTGVYTGFMPVATSLGMVLAHESVITVMALGLFLGFLVAFAEPAVSILGDQVEAASNHMLKKLTIVVVISLGVAILVAIGMAKIMLDISLVYIIVPGYIITIILMWLGEKDMVGIAFDAGGVSTGPMSVAILSSIYVGISSVLYTGTQAVINGFGLIALIALAPCLFLSAMSVMTKYKKKKAGELNVQ